jgi:hypothetical protein
LPILTRVVFFSCLNATYTNFCPFLLFVNSVKVNQEICMGHVLLELQSNSSELRRWSVLDFLKFYDENTEFLFISMTMFAFLIVYEL